MDKQIAHYQNKLNYEIDAWDLNASMKEHKNIIVIDTRSAEAYSQEHIPTAINIPHRTMCQSSTHHLDKTALYVTYCDGIGCNASTKGALNMAKLGFSVKELIGGLEWWLKDGYETHGDKSKSTTNNPCDC